MTFPFADATRRLDAGHEIVDNVATPPDQDESAFLVGLMTAHRSSWSLWLAPGTLITAPGDLGRRHRQRLLARATCTIAASGFTREHSAAGNDRKELDKRLAAELIEAAPSLFLDNANGVALRSDTLASVLTERPARVCVLGQTRMVPLNTTAFVVVTGNGLTVTGGFGPSVHCLLA